MAATVLPIVDTRGGCWQAAFFPKGEASSVATFVFGWLSIAMQLVMACRNGITLGAGSTFRGVGFDFGQEASARTGKSNSWLADPDAKRAPEFENERNAPRRAAPCRVAPCRCRGSMPRLAVARREDEDQIH